MFTTSIHIPDDAKAVIEDYIKTTGDTLSDFATRAMLSVIEDEMDLQAYNAAEAHNTGKPALSLAEMEQALG